jgi:hypothetical protein
LRAAAALALASPEKPLFVALAYEICGVAPGPVSTITMLHFPCILVHYP